MHSNRLVSLSILVGMATLATGSVVLMLPHVPIADESVHFLQAQMFARGDWSILPTLSTWPTTNLLVAPVLSLFGLDSLQAARATIIASSLV